MGFISIIGTVAACLTTAANLPQAAKIIRTKSVKDISVWTYLLLFTGLSSWTFYGFLRDDWPLLISNGISALLAGIVLAMKLTIKKQENQE